MRPVATGTLALLEMAHDRGLEARETELGEMRVALREGTRHQVRRRRVAIGVREAGRRQIDRAIVALAREAIDRRTARIAKTEQLGDLVVGLARRVVTRPSDQPVDAGLRHEIQAGVTAGDDEDRGRQRDGAVLEKDRLDVAGQMVDRDNGLVSVAAAAFANETPTRSEPTRPGPCVTAIASMPFQSRVGIGQRRLDDAADVADVLA